MNTFRQRHGLPILFISGLCFWSGITILLPTLPLYIQSIGGTKQQIGLVMGAFSIGLLPSRFGLGPLADAKGRKLVLIIGAGVATLAPLAYLSAQSIAPLFGIRAFHGISIAAFTIGFSALVADLAPVMRRGEVIGQMGLVNPIGMAIGPAIGGFVEAAAGYPLLFLISATFGGLSLVGVSQVWEPPRHHVVPNQPEFSKPETQKNGLEQFFEYFKLIFHPALRTPAFVLLNVGLIFGTLVTFLPLSIQESGLNFNAGLFYSAAAIASFTSRLFVGRASDRRGRGMFITLGLVFYLLSMLVLAMVPDRTTLLAAGVLEGAGAGIVIPTMLALITDRCQPEARGQFFSLCLGGFDMGLALAGPIFGWITAQVGYQNTYLVNAILALTAILAFMLQSNQTVKHSLLFSMGQTRDGYKIEP
ncbi:MAG: MFS transporter [Microcoleaceae cyanobacterium]